MQNRGAGTIRRRNVLVLRHTFLTPDEHADWGSRRAPELPTLADAEHEEHAIQQQEIARAAPIWP